MKSFISNFVRSWPEWLKRTLKILCALIVLTIFTIEFTRSWTSWLGIDNKSVTFTDLQRDLLSVANLDYYFGSFRALAFFTFWSNASVVFLIVLCWIFRVKMKTEFKAMFFSYLFIAGIGFWTFIAPFWAWGVSAWSDFTAVWEHAIILLFALAWLFSDINPKRLEDKFYKITAFPFLYLLMNIVAFIFVHQNAVAYPFLNFANWFGLGLPLWISYLATLLTLLLFFGTFMFTFWVIIWLIEYFGHKYNWYPKRKRDRKPKTSTKKDLVKK